MSDRRRRDRPSRERDREGAGDRSPASGRLDRDAPPFTAPMRMHSLHAPAVRDPCADAPSSLHSSARGLSDLRRVRVAATGAVGYTFVAGRVPSLGATVEVDRDGQQDRLLAATRGAQRLLVRPRQRPSERELRVGAGAHSLAIFHGIATGAGPVSARGLPRMNSGAIEQTSKRGLPRMNSGAARAAGASRAMRRKAAHAADEAGEDCETSDCPRMNSGAARAAGASRAMRRKAAHAAGEGGQEGEERERASMARTVGVFVARRGARADCEHTPRRLAREMPRRSTRSSLAARSVQLAARRPRRDSILP